MKQSKPQLLRVLARSLPVGAVLGLFLLPLMWTGGTASPQPARANKADNAYIGSKKCQNCHSADASGNQWAVWEGTGHSHAMAALASDEAKKIAAERGIGDPAKSDQCLKCHSTGHGLPADQFKKSFDPSEGVGCETCHGPADNHAKARFRAAMSEDDDEGFGDEAESSYPDIPAGEIVTGITREVCVKCHNDESPTYKPFCFYERVNKIRHINPEKPRTDAERAALLVCGCGDTCTCDHECVDGCGVLPK